MRSCELVFSVSHWRGQKEVKDAQVQTVYHQAFRRVGGWLERENRRTRLPKSALLEILAEESIRTHAR